MLQIAIQLDPDYSDAMAYMNLLYRIEAGIADTPAQSADGHKADNWVTQALDAKRRRRRSRARQPGRSTWKVRRPCRSSAAASSPPPGAPGASQARMEAPGAIRVTGERAAGRLVPQVPPDYPAERARLEPGGASRRDHHQGGHGARHHSHEQPWARNSRRPR